MGLIFKENLSPYSFKSDELVFRTKRKLFGFKKENVLSIVEKIFHGFEDGTESIFVDLLKDIKSDYSFNWINFGFDYNKTFYVPINVSTHDEIIKNIENKKQIIIDDNYCGYFDTDLMWKNWTNPNENTNFYTFTVRTKRFTIRQLDSNDNNKNVITLTSQFKFDLFRSDVQNPEYNYLNRNTDFFKDNEKKIIELLNSCKIPFRYN